MKKLILFILMTYTLACSAEIINILFDRANEDHTDLKLKNSARIVKGKAFSGEKMLEISGKNDNNQYAVNFQPILVKVGDEIGFSCMYRSSRKFTLGLIVCLYRDEKNKLVSSEQIRLRRSLDWDRLENIFRVPDNPKIKSATVYIRLVKVSETEALYVDNLRCGKLSADTPFRCEKLENIVFRDWRNNTPVQERFISGPGGKLLRDWQMAKLGEACYMAEGNGHPYQYPLCIKKLQVEAGRNYVFSFDYRTEGPYVSNNGMFIVFFRDADGKAIKNQNRIKMVDSKSWSRRELIFSAPSKAAFADIKLRLYKQSPDAKIYVDDIDFNEGKPSLRLEWTINSNTKKLLGAAKLLSADTRNPITVTLKDKKGAVVKTIETFSKGKFSIDLASIAEGKYDISASVKTAGNILKSPVGTFHNYKECTWKNDIGILKNKDNPSRPWKALKYDAASNSVTTWNSVVSFNQKLEIKGIRSVKPAKELFKKSTQLLINGKPIEGFKSGKIRVLSNSPNHILLQNTLSSEKMNITVNAQIEYDGFVKYTLELCPQSALTIKSLELKYFPSVMDWQVCYDGSWSKYQLLDMRKKKEMTSKRFYPMLWTGNSESGVYWCAEQLYPAAEVMPEVCQSAEFGGGVKVDIVCEPLELAVGKKRVFEYGFGSTPVRPKRPEGRNLRFRAGRKYSNMDMAWSTSNNMESFGFPKAATPDVFPDYLEKNKGKLMFFYQCPSFAMTNIPQWKYYEQEWTSIPLRIYSSKTTMKKWGYDDIKINQEKRTWTDLYMKHFRKFLSKHKFGGVYYDCMNIYPDKRGKEFRYRVFALRDFYSRIYNEQVRLNPDTWFFAHTGATFFTIASIYADITLTGEEYRSKCMDYDFYLEFLTPDKFRVQMCTNTGAWRMFLPQFRNERSRKPEVAVHAVGLTLVYNLMLYPSFIDRKYIDRMRDRKFAFIDAGGRDKWKFTPYWENNPSNNSKVLTSAYTNSKGQLLACLNSTAKEQEFKLRISDGDKKIYVYDPLTNETKSIKSNEAIKLKPYMAKMVLVADSQIWLP